MKLWNLIDIGWKFTKEFTLNIFRLTNKYEGNRRLDGLLVVITGANAGIGKETAYQMSIRGAKVIIGCRDVMKAINAIKDIKQRNPKANIYSLPLDLSSLQSVRQFVTEITKRETKVDILINNAGVCLVPESQTIDGYELQFGTNHLGHFLLTLSLLPLLRKPIKARVVTLSSIVHRLGEIHFNDINLRTAGAYNPLTGYTQSKLANVLFTRELARRLGYHSTVTAYSLHPGAVATDWDRNSGSRLLAFGLHVIGKPFQLSVERGCQTTLYCALEEALDNESGFYYSNCQRVDDMVSTATDDKSAEQLWQLSQELVRLEVHLRLPKYGKH